MGYRASSRCQMVSGGFAGKLLPHNGAYQGTKRWPDPHRIGVKRREAIPLDERMQPWIGEQVA